MSRNDAGLYTGSNSRSFTSPKADEVKEKQKLAKDERDETAHKLKPDADAIFTLLADEKAAVILELAKLPYIAQTSKEDVKEMLMAYQRNLYFIDAFSKKLKVLLQEKR